MSTYPRAEANYRAWIKRRDAALRLHDLLKTEHGLEKSVARDIRILIESVLS